MRGFAAIGLCAPKCDANVGGVMRAAMCYGASMIAIQGQRYQRKEGAKRTDTTAAYRHIPVLHGSLRDLIPHACIPVAVEFIKESRPLTRYAHPERAFYIFGPEDGNVPNEIVQWCEHVVHVPTEFCMNLAATVNVVLYDRLLKGPQA
jgi:tRNA(Leu) C34 or U34 (ribose-2'-O)-methylase TrmL